MRIRIIAHTPLEVPVPVHLERKIITGTGTELLVLGSAGEVFVKDRFLAQKTSISDDAAKLQ